MVLGFSLAIVLLSVAAIISGASNKNMFTIIDNLIRNKKA